MMLRARSWAAPLLAPLLASLTVVGALDGCGKEADGPPPVILVSLDTFRADRIGAYGNADGLTPNLDAFAAEGTVFENVYSQAVQTAPSHTSMFTSRYPSEVGTEKQLSVPKEIPLLAQLMSLYDYHTGAFVGGADLSAHRGLNAGFDVYEAPTDFGTLYHTGPKALAWLATIKDERPYFMFVHGYDAHSRYLKPPPYGYAHADARATGAGQDAVRTATERVVDGVVYPDFSALMASYETLLRPRSEEGKARTAALASANLSDRVTVGPEDVELIADVYDGAVSYADTMFGLFVAALEERGALDEAVIVLMSDHGEQLGEHGLFGHCCETNDEETHVPLIIRMPKGEGGGRRVSAYVELVDVAPTILELVGATAPAGIQGRSLMPALRGEPFEGRRYVYTEGTETMRMISMRGPEGRFTYTGLATSSPLLPDVVASSRLDGPGFTAVAPAEDHAEMRTAMVTWLRGLSLAPETGAPAKELPASLRKTLREHGYWDVKE